MIAACQTLHRIGGGKLVLDSRLGMRVKGSLPNVSGVTLPFMNMLTEQQRSSRQFPNEDISPFP